MTFDPTVDYPLGSRRPDLVETPSGLALEEVTLESARAGSLVAADVRATSATLRRQAAVARVPDDQLLAIYTALRPGRSTPAVLEDWALRLDDWDAPRTAVFVREAAVAYGERGLGGV